MNDPRRPATTIDTHRRARRARKQRRSSSNRSLFSLLAGVFSRSAAADGRRGMFVEPLEERRLLTVGPTLYVANSFYDQTTAANTSTPTAGDTVNWLASGQFAEVDGLTFGTNAFSTIQAAASYAAANDSSGATIDVAAGTYNESPDITSSVTLQGAQHGVDARSGRSAAQESIIIGQISGGAVPDVMDGFTFGSSSGLPGPGPMQTSVAFTNFTFENNIVQNVNSFYLANIAGLQSATIEQNLFRNMDNSSHNASAMNIFGGNNITIENNAIDGTTFSGIQADDDDNLTISGNTVTNVKYNGIQVGSFCSGNIDVTGNTVTGVDTAGAVAGPDTGGIRLYGVQPGSTVNVTNNLVTNSYNGLTVVNGSDLSTSTYHVNDNSFAGNANVGLYNGATTGTLDAGLNWWGNASGPTVASNPGGTGGAVSANVDYSPWLTVGTNNAVGTGFQGDLSRLSVNAGSPSANPAIGIIQQAINAATPGGTITVAAGTYNEGSILVNKPLTLDGPNAGINPNTGTRVAEAILSATSVPAGGNFINVGANNVTINGFTVEGSPDAGILTGDSGGQILDNIVTNNEIGIYADCTGPTLIQGNLVTANNVAGAAGGTAIYSDATNGLTINDNVINDQTINSAITFAASSANVHKNLTVSNNSIAINAPGNSAIYVVAVDGGVFSGNDITANGGGSGIHLAGDDTNIAIHNNNLVNNTNGVSITDDGYGFGPNAGVTVNDNRFLGNTTGLNVASGANVYSGTSLDATKNWWGDVSGPTIAGNVGGDGQTITAPANLVSYAPWLIYGTNAAPAGTPGFQLPAVVPVTSQGDVSPAVNDFTIIQNAIGAAAAGQTIDLSGTFDWTKPNAAAAYAASNLTADPGHDIRGAALPDGVNNLTITSSNGTAKIIGAGDSTDGVYHSFVFSAVQGVGATGNNNLTISNLNVYNFMSGVTLGWNNGGAFNGTLVKNNTITVAADNNNSLNDVQGIAVYFWNGQNQTMTGNTIDFMGDGTRTIGTGARSLGFQDGTTGADGYQGLSIDHNIFQLLPSAIGGHETVTGIWENGHNDNTGTHISIADNQFLGIQGQRQFDIGVQLSSQSTNMAVDGNTFTDVKYVYWVGAHNGDVNGDQFTFTNNTLTRVGDANGVFLQNVASDASPPYTVTINWGTNNTIDGFTGIRGLNELSTQATGASRPNGAATDLAAVDAFGPMPADYVNGSWGTQGRFTNPLAAPDGTPGPIAFGFNTFNTIQDGVNAIDPAGTVNVLPGTYAENVTIAKNLTLVGVTPAGAPASPPTAILQPTSGDGITINAPATNVTVANLAITGADNAINAAGVTTLNLTDLTLTGNSSGGDISNVGTLNDTPLTGGTGATDTITGATIQRGTDDTINYSNVGNLNIIGSDGSDTFNVTPATTTAISINGGLPTPPALPGDTLNVNSAGLTSPALSYSTTADGDRGKFTFGNAAPVNFQAIETLANVSNLSITKTDNSPKPGFEVPGSSITYTIVVANNGPNDVTGATVSDAFPTDLTNASYTASETGNATGFSASGNTSINDTVDLPNGSTITYVVTAVINPSATGTLTNTATVSVSSPIVQTATATDSDTLTPTADLSITNTDNSPTPGHVQTGQALTYTVVVTNGGPSDVTGASVADTLPAGFDGASYSAIATGGATGFIASGSGNINDTVNMPVGSTITYTITGTIDAAATGTLLSVATVGAPLGVTDPNSANNSVTDSNVVSTEADLSITKTDNSATPGSVVPGTPLTYTIVVSNTGPGDVTGATVADTYPADFTGVTYTATSTGTASGFTANGSGNIDDTVDLAVGSTITYIVKGTIAAAATGTLTNTAKITPPADTIDTNTTNNSATDTDTLTPQAGLTITKTDNSVTPGSAVPGTSLIYTITVSNSGPSDAPGTVITDSLPANFTAATFTSSGSAGVSGNTANGSGNINDTVLIPAHGSVTYTVTGTINPAATGSLDNTATITAGAGVTDTNTATSASDNLTLTPQADLSVTQSDNKGGDSTTPNTGSVVAGTSLTYTIVVKNSGPNSAIGATVTDTFPANFTVISATPLFTGGASITASGGSGGNISDTVNLPVGGEIVYVVTGTLSASAGGTLSNTATVAAPAGVTDTTTTNNTATDSDNITSQANLSIVKSDSAGGDSATNAQGSVVAGTAMTYTIVVTNSGPSAVSGATVSDALPADFSATGLSHVLVGGASITASAGGSINDTVNLPAGGSIVYFLSGTVSAAATGTLSNSAQVAAGANSASALDTDAVTTQAKISITKTDNTGGNSATGAKGSIAPGSTVTYTVVVSNSGPSDVTGATINDALPAGISGFSYTASAAGGATGFSATGSGAIDDTAVNLPVGGSVTYVVTASVAPGASGVVTNTANVTLPGGEVNSGSGSAAVSDNVAATVPQGIGYLAGAPGDGTAQTFVHNLYRELLGREPDPAGEAYWVAQVQQNDTAAGRQTVISSFLNSTEYKDHYITTLYEVFLGRAPEAAGLQFWTAKMGEPGTAGGHSGSADEKLILAGIVGSDEFYADVGGTSQGFVHALYQDLLGRSSSPAEQTFWVNLLQSQQQNRDGIVRLFLSSPEAAHKLLDSFYPAPGGTAANPLPAPGAGVPAHTYDLATVTGLGWENLYLQGPFGNSPEGNDAFFTALAGGDSWDDVQLELLASDQFYNNPNRPVTS